MSATISTHAQSVRGRTFAPTIKHGDARKLGPVLAAAFGLFKKCGAAVEGEHMFA